MRFWIPCFSKFGSPATRNPAPGVWKEISYLGGFDSAKKGSGSSAIVSEILVLDVSFADPG